MAATLLAMKTATASNSIGKPSRQKHVVAPATAAEIRTTIGITKGDKHVVYRVLMDLGYLPKRPPHIIASSKAKSVGKRRKTAEKKSAVGKS